MTQGHTGQEGPLLVADGVTLQYKTADHLVTATWRVGFEVFEEARGQANQDQGQRRELRLLNLLVNSSTGRAASKFRGAPFYSTIACKAAGDPLTA